MNGAVAREPAIDLTSGVSAPFPLVLIVHGNHEMTKFSDPGYQDQIYLGAPRTYEVATSFRW